MRFWKALFKATIGTIAPAEERISAPAPRAKTEPLSEAPVKRQETRMQDVTAPEVSLSVSAAPAEAPSSVSLEPKKPARRRVKKQPVENTETPTLS